jgi:uncharacterized protein YfaT (DUF1175 family)
LAAAVCAGALFRREPPVPPRLSVEPSQLLADGYDTATLTVESAAQPRVEATNATVKRAGDGRFLIRASVTPGPIRVRVNDATIDLTSSLDPRDSANDGTPDFLRLQDEADRSAFRGWFTFLAEVQYFHRAAEVIDCAALLRYAYREALRRHDGPWATAAGIPFAPAFDSIAKYQYPYTPLGASLFRVKEGAFRASDLSDGTFLQFADAQTLRRLNTHSVGRDLERARPGDLLFFRQDREHRSFHSMIYLGESMVRPDGQRYIVYHTGPDGSDPGEVRRLTVEELQQFPRAEWRPAGSNPGFLGVSRWNILR